MVRPGRSDTRPAERRAANDHTAGAAMSVSDRMRSTLASRFLNTPLALRADQAGVIVSALTTPQAGYYDYAEPMKTARDDRPFDVVGSVAVIPVKGVLLSRLPRW